jgi:peroxidase
MYLEQAGGPYYAVELGRLDGRSSTIASVKYHLPKPDFNLDQLHAMFAKHGLTLRDLIALSGRSYAILRMWTMRN